MYITGDVWCIIFSVYIYICIHTIYMICNVSYIEYEPSCILYHVWYIYIHIYIHYTLCDLWCMICDTQYNLQYMVYDIDMTCIIFIVQSTMYDVYNIQSILDDTQYVIYNV